MAPLIDKELEKVDKRHAQLSRLSGELIEGLNMYHNLMKEVQPGPTSVPYSIPNFGVSKATTFSPIHNPALNPSMDPHNMMFQNGGQMPYTNPASTINDPNRSMFMPTGQTHPIYVPAEMSNNGPPSSEKQFYTTAGFVQPQPTATDLPNVSQIVYGNSSQQPPMIVQPGQFQQTQMFPQHIYGPQIPGAGSAFGQNIQTERQQQRL